jgi:hypothetical protein
MGQFLLIGALLLFQHAMKSVYAWAFLFKHSLLDTVGTILLTDIYAVCAAYLYGTLVFGNAARVCCRQMRDAVQHAPPLSSRHRRSGNRLLRASSTLAVIGVLNILLPVWLDPLFALDTLSTLTGVLIILPAALYIVINMIALCALLLWNIAVMRHGTRPSASGAS